VDTSGYEEMRVPHVALARERLAPPLDPELEARALKAAVEQIRRNWRIVEEAHVRSR